MVDCNSSNYRDRRVLGACVRPLTIKCSLVCPATTERAARAQHRAAAGSGDTRQKQRRENETIRQKMLVETLTAQRIVPGIKVDTGAKPLAGFPGETITEGLDGLRDRLLEYRAVGARFAKWRAVIHVTETLPTCVSANAHALGRYAATCQDRNLGRLWSPKCSWTGRTRSSVARKSLGILHAVFHALFAHS
jgi:fructose-bisphosphate aldolase class 1